MENDFKIQVSTAGSRLSKAWQREEICWSEFARRCSEYKVTGETMDEYAAMDRDRRGSIKDCGGFTSALSGPRRTSGAVLSCSLVSLDFDSVGGSWGDFAERCAEAFAGHAWLAYETHSSRPGQCRARCVVPLARACAPGAYALLARCAAARVNIAWADSTTAQAERMMYWPSRPKDGPHAFAEGKGRPVQPGDLLLPGVDWQRPETWPRFPGEEEGSGRGPARMASREPAPNPLLKGGIVGAFCRAHWPICEAIEELLPDCYERAGKGRYTYIGGGSTTAGGAVAMPADDGGEPVEECFLRSFHDHDPAQGLRNIYDLVRIHRYGHLDASAPKDAPVEKLPSDRAMREFAQSDPKTAAVLAGDLRRQFEGFAGEMPPEGAAPGDKASPAAPARGKVENTSLAAAAVIAELLPGLWFDEFAECAMVDGPLPWRKNPSGKAMQWTDADDAMLRAALEQQGVKGRERVADAVQVVLMRRRRNPLTDWLRSLKWDGKPRLDTCLADWLGAEDTPATRAMTRAAFVGLVRRALKPGCKHDYALLLHGREGIGKSTFLASMGSDWFTDCVLTADGKEAMVQLQRAWLVELGEMAAAKKSDVESMKAFLSRRTDDFRRPYGRQSEARPRHCAFFATTNEPAVRFGENGGRRWWPVECGIGPVRDMAALLQPEGEGGPCPRDLILAEAMELERRGEPNYLSREMEEQALALREEMNADGGDELAQALAAFLERLVPEGWAKMDREERRRWKGSLARDFSQQMCVRMEFAPAEFVCEELGIGLLDPRFKATIRKVNQAMKDIKGWVPVVHTNCAAAAYGRSRGWRKVIDSDTQFKNLFD